MKVNQRLLIRKQKWSSVQHIQT